ncbi:MAG: hypothetical protein R2724_20765 [Bryobacterales bacterium]
MPTICSACSDFTLLQPLAHPPLLVARHQPVDDVVDLVLDALQRVGLTSRSKSAFLRLGSPVEDAATDHLLKELVPAPFELMHGIKSMSDMRGAKPWRKSLLVRRLSWL